MKNQIMSILPLTAAMAGLSIATSAYGAVIITNTSNSTPNAEGLTASATDLVNQGQSTLASPYTSSTAPNFGAGTVNDGQAAVSVNDAAFYWTSESDFPATLVFNFNVGVNTLGYNITQINSLAGWQGGSTQTYANQKFTVEYSVVGSATYTLLTSVDYSPFTSTSSSTAAYSQSAITDGTGVLATGVDSLRFVYSDPTVSGGTNRGTVIQEIDVLGVATVPEPSVAVFGLLSVLSVLGIRRR
jgi:hypothetical protein